MSNPLVSVIIPFFAYDDYLLDTVSCVESQTYGNIEIIVVDDCSPHLPAAELLAGRDKLVVKVIRHQSNLGPAASRNTAVNHARGQMILPLDADDLISPEFVETTVESVLGTEYAGAYTDIKLFGDVEREHAAECDIHSILRARGGHNTFLYKKEVHTSVGGYKPHVRIGIDKEFWLSVLSKGWRFVHIPRALYHYRIHMGQLTEGIEKRGAEMMAGLLAEHRHLFIEHIDDWFPDKERQHSMNVSLARELQAECQAIDENYAQLKEELRRTRAHYARLQNDYDELLRRSRRSPVKLAWSLFGRN